MLKKKKYALKISVIHGNINAKLSKQNNFTHKLLVVMMQMIDDSPVQYIVKSKYVTNCIIQFLMFINANIAKASGC